MNVVVKPHPRRPGLLYRSMMSFMGLFDAWLHLSCRSFVQTASCKYERPLTAGERFRQALHRIMCHICRIQERRMDQLRALVRDLGHGDDAQDELSPESLRRMREDMARTARDPSSRR
jgi:hypothetical protein